MLFMKNIIYTIIFLGFTQLLNAQSYRNSTMRFGANGTLAPFYHGVASGDPLSDAVIIWTRVTTDSISVDVDWRVATDTGMVNIVSSGTVTTDTSKDHTVKVDVTGLQADQFYYYEFTAYNTNSVRGRTRTAPLGNIDSLRFAVVSCSGYPFGYFNAYERITERNDINAVLHLGDYLYESGNSSATPADRLVEPTTEIISLEDYRMRHSHYKLDAALMRVHQQYPFICIWDDHETANDSWYGGAQNHTDSTEGNWFSRKARGIQAYYEWMPLRMPDPTDPERIYRKFSYGDLVDLYMLDTRLEGREEQNGTLDTSSNRTILGQQQFDWLVNGLKNSTAQWNLIGQQVVMAPVNTNITGAPNYPNGDQWDGYRGERKKLFDSISVNNITNTVVMTGDVHCAWANDLPTDTYNSTTGAGSAGVEFVATSVTSPLPQNISSLGQLAENFIKAANNHVKYINVRNKGYYILDVNKIRTQADYYVVDRIDSPSVVQNHDASWFTLDGTQHLNVSTTPSVASQNLRGLQAPLYPRQGSTFTKIITSPNNWESVILGTYPNPFWDQFAIHYALHETTDISLQIVNTLGQVVLSKKLNAIEAGVYHWYIDASSLGKGSYYMIFKTNNKTQKRLLVKN